jgi:hypothetical protein
LAVSIASEAAITPLLAGDGAVCGDGGAGGLSGAEQSAPADAYGPDSAGLAVGGLGPVPKTKPRCSAELDQRPAPILKGANRSASPVRMTRCGESRT